MSLDTESRREGDSSCHPFARNTFVDIFQVEVLIGQDSVTGPVFLLPAGGLEAFGGQGCTFCKFAFQAGGSAADATQARLLEGVLREIHFY